MGYILGDAHLIHWGTRTSGQTGLTFRFERALGNLGNRAERLGPHPKQKGPHIFSSNFRALVGFPGTYIWGTPPFFKKSPGGYIYTEQFRRANWGPFLSPVGKNTADKLTFVGCGATNCGPFLNWGPLLLKHPLFGEVTL